MPEAHVHPMENALDSVQRIGDELSRLNSNELFALKGALGWGWHAVALLAYVRLQPHRDDFDAWLQDYLEAGEPALNTDRDARWENRERLSSLELIDLLSEVQLSILKPEFYQGWQDRASRCRTLREKVSSIIGESIDTTQRDKLLLLLAAYHRLVRLPAGVTLDTSPVREAFPALLGLLMMMVDKKGKDAPRIKEAVERSLVALKN